MSTRLATDGSVAGQMIVGNIVKQGNLIDDDVPITRVSCLC